MAIVEFICPIHGKFERLCAHAEFAQCPFFMDGLDEHNEPIQCGTLSPKVEWSVPAKRNPRYGIG
jgi:hypothetical protein